MNSLLGGQPYNPQMMQLLGLDPAEMRRQALWQGLTQAGLGLLGMGPSRTPIGFGDYLAAGAQGGIEGALAGKEAYLQNAVDAWQMQQMADDAAYKKTQQAQENTKFDAWQSDRQQAEDLRAGQQQASQGFLQDWQSQGGDLFPQWQGALRQQGIGGVDPSMTQTAQRMQPYMQAGDYGGAFGQMTAQGDKSRLMSVGKDSTLYDPESGQWLTPPGQTGGQAIDDPMKVTKDYQAQPGFERIKQVAPTINSMIASLEDPSAMADLDFVYGLAKILDPTSVVRESEAGMVIEAQGIGPSLLGQLNKILKGEQAMLPEVRRKLVGVAVRRAKELQAQAEQERTFYENMLRANQFDPNTYLQNVPIVPDAPSVDNDPLGIRGP